jgi:hypothetical protein
VSPLKLLKSTRGEATVGAVTVLLTSLFIIAFVLFRLFPVFTAKQQLDTYAQELCRTAEICGRVGTETTERARELTENTGLSPTIEWSDTGEIQLGEKISVTCSIQKDIGLFAGIGSVPVTLTSRASGKSEVYWKE